MAARLVAAFVVVAALALSLLVALLLVATRSQVSSLVTRDHEADAAAAAAAAGAAYTTAGGWDGADLAAAAALAARGQATLIVTDPEGTVLAAATDQAARLMAEMHGIDVVDVPRGDPVIEPVVVDGDTVGAVHLAYPQVGLPSAAEHVRDSLSQVAVAGALSSALAAIAVAVFVARRITRPIEALTAAAEEVESGGRDVRVGYDHAPGELGRLSRAFDRMAAAVRRQDELRRQLVADVAHEVRTPLTILRGTTEGLVDGVVSPDPATLASLHDEVLRLTNLVADLETLAAADAAGLSLHQVRTNLAEVAAAAVDLARPAATAAGLVLDTAFEPAFTWGDPQRLRQVVVNLLSNAVRYTPAPGVVTVRTGTRGDGVFLDVADTGPGLGSGDVERLFDRFQRGDAAADTRGTGIGLAIARELVTAHGGSIRAAEREGGGAQFTVSLPRAAGQPADA